jgi:bisphosphoglycerate-dependent phosphoglycerate mutase family 1
VEVRSRRAVRHRRDAPRRLSRAIETAWLALQELDALWVPIIKSWRLNERMYGALTGLSKKAILGEHGEARFKQWRCSNGVHAMPRRLDAVVTTRSDEGVDASPHAIDATSPSALAQARLHDAAARGVFI